MNKLTDLPNIGGKLAELLERAGIETPEQLRNLGSKQAFLMISAVTDCACINKLYAIEGAIQGINKKLLASETKADLLEYFRSLKKL
ncbi:MAG: TfoX/Sxy family protein [Bacillota bacterium]